MRECKNKHPTDSTSRYEYSYEVRGHAGVYMYCIVLVNKIVIRVFQLIAVHEDF